MKNKMIQMDEETHKRFKNEATNRGMTLAGFMRWLSLNIKGEK